MYLRQYDSSIDCFTKALFLELAAEMSFGHVCFQQLTVEAMLS